MGRYYNGDIEGKFWFGIQSSDDANFFGVNGTEPNYLEYYFLQDDLPKVEQGIKQCEKVLSAYKELLDKFFSEGGDGYNGYNDEQLLGYLLNNSKQKTTMADVKTLLKYYARLKLGKKIANCIKKNGQCYFEAEL